ncbi:MAG TPA: hypothetical protein VD905_07425 [Flavobacteriales bacterium]|nr:hypothetical protein [Flavobacteriales bacterium]
MNAGSQTIDNATSAGGGRLFVISPMKERAKKSMLYFSIVSMIMLFAGLTSAVIVSKGGNFWVSTRLPNAFYISTTLIAISSVFIFMAQKAIQKNNFNLTKTMLLVSLLLGIGFGIYQYLGYKQLVDGGYFFTSRILDDEGNFVPTGKYGSDFTVTWKGEHLRYENGIFYKSTGPLSEQENLKLKWTRNTASSFIYILTFLHLLHMVGGILYVLFVTIFAFQLRFDSSNYLKIKLANIYWHFLGLLWIYLFVFLQYIH